MWTLALEFSSERRSVALLEANRVAGQAAEANGRHTRAFALIEAALHQAGKERECVQSLVVGLGPGSYTGIRSAIALAQGWQVATNVRLQGIPSLEALALQAQNAGLVGRIHFLFDAQRNDLCLATYLIEPERLQLISPLRRIASENADGMIQNDGVIVGPDLAPRFPKGKTMLPDAATLGRLAAGRHDYVSGDILHPIYLRETNFLKAPPARGHPTV